jgi:hypothetical protein
MPGLCSYAQSHVVSAVTPAACAMAIDGFAELAFESVAARAAAYGSPELAACDLDSPRFIGAVSRLITDAETVVPCPDRLGIAKLIILLPPGAPADTRFSRASLERLEPLRRGIGRGGLIWHQVLEQGRAPNSVVPELLCPVAALTELWVEDAFVRDVVAGDQAAVFAVTEHRLC